MNDRSGGETADAAASSTAGATHAGSTPARSTNPTAREIELASSVQLADGNWTMVIARMLADYRHELAASLVAESDRVYEGAAGDPEEEAFSHGLLRAAHRLDTRLRWKAGSVAP